MLPKSGQSAGRHYSRNYWSRLSVFEQRPYTMNLSTLTSLNNLMYLGGGILCIGAVLLARKHQTIAWALFSVCLFATSLSEFRNQFVQDPPDLIFPLEQIRAMGRPISALLVGMLLLTNLNKKISPYFKWNVPIPIKFLVLLQLIVVMKGLEGDWHFALYAFLTFCTLNIMLFIGPYQWIQESEQGIEKGIRAIAISALIFLSINGLQALVDSYPITFVHNRFLGTTGNPQHAATLLALSFPCCLYSYEKQRQWHIGKCFWFGSLFAVAYPLFLTGSRTGALMAVITLFAFYHKRLDVLLRLLLLILVLYLLSSSLLGVDISFFTSEHVDITQRFVEAKDNTRGDVWAALWRNFQKYPLYGAPLKGDRVGYGENSWLAAGASLGLLGFIPLLLFAISTIRSMFNLSAIAARQTSISLESSVVISGISSLLVGSFFEAFLLGNLTYPLIALMVFLLLMQTIIEQHNSQISSLIRMGKVSALG